jgi:glycosyltransferase involved in cell wall biosynthesis
MLDRWSLSERAWRKRAYMFFLERATLHGAAAFHFTSDAEHERSVTFGSKTPACVVPLGLKREVWANLPARGGARRLWGLGDVPVLLYLSRLHPKKRPDLLIDAFGAVAREFRDAVLVLAGPGEPGYVSGLRRLAAQLTLSDRVVFTGPLSGRAVQEALVDADVFVLPSLQENFALAVAEAMAARCPVVVSPHVGLAADIEKHGAGLVVEPQAEVLGDALCQLLRDAGARRAMGENGRRLVLERYTWDRAAREMAAVYEDILQGARRSRAWR